MPLKEVDWDNFVFRSHYFGELMTKTRGKNNLQKYEELETAHDKMYDRLDTTKDGKVRDGLLIKMLDLDNKLKELKLIKDIPTLSGTCKKRLAQIYTEETTGRKKDIESMYLEKGLKTEEKSITLYSLRTGLYYKKNKIRENNGWVTGEIDFEDEEKDLVIDTKSSWDAFTFDATVAKGMSHTYEWQGHCYMWLRNKKNFRLAYCLNNTPSEITSRLVRRLENTFIGAAEDLEDAIVELKHNHNFDDLPLERKVRIYDLKRDDEKIELAKSYIPHFRNYLKNITNSKFEEDYDQD